MTTDTVEAVAVTEETIVKEIEKLVSSRGSCAMWIIGVTDDPEALRAHRGAFNWQHWNAGDSEIAKKVCDLFTSKGMVVDVNNATSEAIYVYVF